MFLERLGVQWETFVEPGKPQYRWLLIHGFPVPEYLGQSCVEMLLNVPTNYPSQQLDMAWFYPALKRVDGVALNAVCLETIEGRGFQRWSRHRLPESAWREGTDDLRTHLEFIATWFEREVQQCVPA